MNALFYISAVVAIISTALTITRSSGIHALLYLIVSLMAVALIFFSLGAPFAAALEVIIYAGAIMVLFLFVIMMFNLGPSAGPEHRDQIGFVNWIGPGILSAVLLAELIYALIARAGASFGAVEVGPDQVGIALFGPYVLGVELASILLLAGLVGAYHLGRQDILAHPEMNAPQAQPPQVRQRSL